MKAHLKKRLEKRKEKEEGYENNIQDQNPENQTYQNRPQQIEMTLAQRQNSEALAQLNNQRINGGEIEVLGEDAAHKDEICEDCQQKAIRINNAEGTLVCQICGLVKESSFIDMTKEDRNFAQENSAKEVNSRTAGITQADQMNHLYTELVGGGKNSGFNFRNQSTGMRTQGSSRINNQKKKRDWFQDWFKTMQRKLHLTKKTHDLAMEKVDQYLKAKQLGVKMKSQLSGTKEPYAIMIMHSVSKDLDLKISLDDIRRIQNKTGKTVEFKNIKDAGKKLNNVFKDWFIQVKTPESLLPNICQKLNLPLELQNDAIEIAKKIKSEIEGCQPITIVGVALYTLNKRLHLLDPSLQIHRKSEQDIASAINKQNLNNVQSNFERINRKFYQILPDKFLENEEKNHDQQQIAPMVIQGYGDQQYHLQHPMNGAQGDPAGIIHNVSPHRGQQQQHPGHYQQPGPPQHGYYHDPRQQVVGQQPQYRGPPQQMQQPGQMQAVHQQQRQQFNQN